MGDAAGIGPEIILKSLALLDPSEAGKCKIIGDLRHLERLRKELNISLDLTELVHDLQNLPETFEIGVDAIDTGKAAAENIEAAVRLWREGGIDGIATAPISKKSISMAGYDYPGHTEFLAELTDTKKFAMSFFADDLRVVLLSTHLSLLDAIRLVEKDRIVDTVAFAALQLEKLLRKRIKIAVAGLNPHASEGGMFGSEEEREIVPAIEYCRKNLGLDVTGPYSPDTIFLRGHRGEFDAVIALYHDQATIPVKSLSFGSAVNVTLGLPLVRTSVDHGTAYDIAGKAIADPSSMIAAMKLAINLVQS